VNDAAFVRRAVDLLRSAGVEAWICGGWGEELRGLAPAGPHGDVDPLHPGDDLESVDAALRSLALADIPAKRFAHKRAFVLDGVMVELLLARRDAHGLHTVRGDVRHHWPADTLSWLGDLPVASSAALRGYRAAHDSFPDSVPA
jgi:hypothetical protein